MKATVKLNPTRIIVPKYNFAPALLLEYICNHQPLPIINISHKSEYFEVQLPLTKHSIRPLLDYINSNLPIEE